VLPQEVEQRLPARDARGVEEVRVAILEVLVDEGPGPEAQRRQVDARDDRRRERSGEDTAGVLDVGKACLTRLS
jgi:hypothetical protein